MKKLLITLLLPLALFAKCPIEFDPSSDGRSWKLAYDGKVDNFTILEYISDEENLATWTRLASVLKRNKVSQKPEAVFQSLVENMRLTDPTAKVTHKILSSNSETLIGEWHMKSSQHPEEHNWVKIFQKNGNVYTLLYTTKNIAEIDRDRSSWEKILENAKVAE